jgi:hypothetical protein
MSYIACRLAALLLSVYLTVKSLGEEHEHSAAFGHVGHLQLCVRGHKNGPVATDRNGVRSVDVQTLHPGAPLCHGPLITKQTPAIA